MEWFLFRQPVNTWTHLLGMVLALGGTVLLWRRSAGNAAKQWGLLVFGACAVYCYGASALFHGARVSEKVAEGPLATLDYIGIYLLIAGTITPMAMTVLGRRWRRVTLIVAWSMAALGIGLRLSPVDVPDGVSNGLYLGMGWALVASYFELSRILSFRKTWLAPLGGVSYSVGAVVNWLHWPRLWPGVFSAHEIMHLCVLGGTFCHFLLMLRIVVPFQLESEPEVAEELPEGLAVQQVEA